MSDGARLSRAILEAPGDDLRRIVYADWLEEHGRPERAEFVRVQLALARRQERLDACPVGRNSRDGSEIRALVCQGETLCRRERELWPGALWDTLDEVRPVIPEAMMVYKGDERPGRTPRRPEAYVHRGFVAEVSLTLADFYGKSGEGCGPRLVLAAPLETVRLSDRRPDVPPPSPRTAGWYCWGDRPDRRHRAEEPDDVPFATWSLLEGHDAAPGHNRSLGYRWYPAGGEAAHAALSAACVAWARAAAGLGALPAGAAP